MEMERSYSQRENKRRTGEVNKKYKIQAREKGSKLQEAKGRR